MDVKRLNYVIENFYKYFYETEDLALKQGIKSLTHTELHIIEAIDVDSLTMNELSERLGITMGTATVAIAKLEDKGFIKRARSEKDRRKVYVTLSKKGNEALSFHNNYHEMIISSITKNVATEKMEAFLVVYEELLSNLESKLEYFRPAELSEFEAGDKVNIIEVKGTPIIKDFFTGHGIEVYSEIVLKSINSRKVVLQINDIKELEISILDAKNLIAIKKEI